MFCEDFKRIATKEVKSTQKTMKLWLPFAALPRLLIKTIFELKDFKKGSTNDSWGSQKICFWIMSSRINSTWWINTTTLWRLHAKQIFAGSLNRLVAQEPQQFVFGCRPAWVAKTWFLNRQVFKATSVPDHKPWFYFHLRPWFCRKPKA